jgi:sporulation protein YlmC with PRC-barrel domain
MGRPNQIPALLFVSANQKAGESENSMKMNSTPLKRVAVTAIILGLGSTLVAQKPRVYETRPPGSNQQYEQQANRPSANPMTTNESSPLNRMQALRQAEQDPRGRNAHDLIGLNVTTPRGEKLGEINDFVVDPQSGKVVYTLISARGSQDAFRAVPFGAIKQDAAPGARRMILDIDQGKWVQAPVFLKSQTPSLIQDQRGREIYQYYGQSPSDQKSQQLLLISELIGSNISSGAQTIGEVDDVIVQIPSGTAAALLDPNDEFAGTDQKYLVPLSRLTRASENVLTTTLSRQDFASAKVASDESWSRSPGGNALFVWPSFAAIQQGGAQRVSQSDPMPAVESIRQALQSDPSATAGQGVISIVASGDRVILGGTVRSNEIKERIEDRAEQAAQGWNVENQIRVAEVNE